MFLIVSYKSKEASISSLFQNLKVSALWQEIKKTISSLHKFLKQKWSSNTTRWRSWEQLFYSAWHKVVSWRKHMTIWEEFSLWITAIKKLSLWWTCKMLVYSKLRIRRHQATLTGNGRKSRHNWTLWIMNSTHSVQQIFLMFSMDTNLFLSQSLNLCSIIRVLETLLQRDIWSLLVSQMISLKFQLMIKNSSTQHQAQELPSALKRKEF